MTLFAKNITNKLSFISSISLMKCFSRNIRLSTISRLKEIKQTESGDTITVEAVKVRSNRSDKLVTNTDAPKDCCPLCRLNLSKLEYTDVLILNQFVESNGKVMPQSITGLCLRMHKRVSGLVKKAQQSRLMPRPLDYKSYGPWDQLNTYYEFPNRFRDQPMRIIEQKYWKSDFEENKL